MTTLILQRSSSENIFHGINVEDGFSNAKQELDTTNNTMDSTTTTESTTTTPTVSRPRRLVKRTSGAYRSSFMDFGIDPSELSFKSLIEMDELPKATSTVAVEPAVRDDNMKNQQPQTAQVSALSLTKQFHHRLLYYCSALVPRTATLWSTLRIRRQRRRARTTSVAVTTRKKRTPEQQEYALGVHQLQRVIQDAVLRNNLADRLLQEHHRESCLSLRFLTAVMDYERTHGWKKRHEKGRRIIALFISKNAKFRINAAKNPKQTKTEQTNGDRPVARRGRFSQYSYLMRLKSAAIAELLRDTVAKQYLSELRELSYMRMADSSVIVDMDEDDQEGGDDDNNEDDEERPMTDVYLY